MKRSRIVHKNNEIIISSEPSPLIARIILKLIIIISALIPIAAAIAMVISEIDFYFGVLISFILFWGIGIYLIKVFLWNKYGREILSYQPDKISYMADYKYFKDSICEISTDNLEASKVEKESGVIIKISNGDLTIMTVVPITIKEAENIIMETKTLYNSPSKRITYSG
jgi:hypothetical protein